VDQLVLAREVQVDAAHRAAYRGGHVAHAEVAVAFPHQQLTGGVEHGGAQVGLARADRVAAGGGRHALGARGRPLESRTAFMDDR
jgi:hypothetical protein